MTLIRGDDARRHTGHLSVERQHIKGWMFWLQRQRMWHQRRIWDFVQTSTSDSQASFHRNTCPESCTTSSSAERHFFTSNSSSTRRSLRSGRKQQQPRKAHRNHTCSNVQQALVPTYLVSEGLTPVLPTGCNLHPKDPSFSCQGSPKCFCTVNSLPDLIRRLSQILLEMAAGISPSKGQRPGSCGTMKKTRTLIADLVYGSR